MCDVRFDLTSGLMAKDILEFVSCCLFSHSQHQRVHTDLMAEKPCVAPYKIPIFWPVFFCLIPGQGRFRTMNLISCGITMAIISDKRTWQ